MNSILITGATGFLGHRTIEYLLEKTDFNIVAAARTKRQERTFLSSRVIYHYGDLTQSNYVASLFDTPLFAIINCASLSAPWGKKSDFVKANIDTQTLLIKYAKKNAVNRFIYISSPSIYVNPSISVNTWQNAACLFVRLCSHVLLYASTQASRNIYRYH